jgi:hypothetical protein
VIVSRREALARLVAITGVSVIGAEFWLAGCARSDKTAGPFSAAEIALLDEIAETIIPGTDTPGAKAAGVGPFMAMMVSDCYDTVSHAIFRDGLAKVDHAAQKRFTKPFVNCTAQDRTTLLNELDREQQSYTQQKAADAAPHYFRLMKDLTLLGYFSSEIGCTRALRYVESPGAYHGDVPYQKGDRAWVNPSHRTT